MRLPYDLQSIEELRKTLTWKEVAQYYKKNIQTVQKYYFRRRKEEGKVSKPIVKPKAIPEDKDMSFYRFIYKELFGHVSRYDKKPALLRKIANELNRRAKEH